MVDSELLISLEQKYGGYSIGIPRHVVSKYDPREKGKARFKCNGMTGGDRMSRDRHNYVDDYVSSINSLSDVKVVVELGILTGIGLAMWCDIFPEARVIGLDIDVKNFNDNKDKLIELGAFKNNQPEIYKFDQYEDNTDFISKILGPQTVDFFIDDGCHFDDAIKKTYKQFGGHMSDEFCYIIEDNKRTRTFLMSTLSNRHKLIKKSEYLHVINHE